MYFSPVIIFAYNRLNHLKKTVESLKRNVYANKTELIIYVDYPKIKNNFQDYNFVKKYCLKIKGFKKKNIIFRKKNFGLSKNIVNGINRELKKYKSIIILEDDMVCDKFFLQYMHYYLNKFEKLDKVVSIHGYNYPLKNVKKINDFFFIRGADCWGWGTWSSKWKIYEKNSAKLIDQFRNKDQVNNFNFQNSYNYYQMLLDAFNKNNDSWAINWYASAFLKNKLTLYPKYSLIKNIGMDGSGVHSYQSKKFNVKLKNKKLNLLEDLKVEEDKNARYLFINFFKSLKPNLINLILNQIKNVFKYKKSSQVL